MDAEWTQVGEDIDGEAPEDRNGESVSLSSDGNIVAIGAVLNSDAAKQAGHVRIFKWDGTAWSKRGGDIDGEAPEDQSGYSVSLSSDGGIVAIGSRYNSDGNGGRLSGHVRIYDWTNDGPCTPCADVIAAAVEQLCQITAASPPNSVPELQDTANNIADTLLAGTDICETDCDIAGQLNAAINQ